MSNKKLFITDERMLTLMDWAITEGLAMNETEYMEKIDFARTNISNVRKGHQGFTKEHIFNACKVTGASADFIFGFTSVLKRKPGARATELLKQAVMSVEMELKGK